MKKILFVITLSIMLLTMNSCDSSNEPIVKSEITTLNSLCSQDKITLDNLRLSIQNYNDSVAKINYSKIEDNVTRGFGRNYGNVYGKV